MTSLLIALIIIFGFAQVAYGSLLLFNNRFYSYMENSVWGERYENEKQEREVLMYNKYTRGWTALIGGACIIGIVGYMTLHSRWLSTFF